MTDIVGVGALIILYLFLALLIATYIALGSKDNPGFFVRHPKLLLTASLFWPLLIAGWTVFAVLALAVLAYKEVKEFHKEDFNES